MALQPRQLGKPSPKDIARVNALEDVIDGELADHGNPTEPFFFSLNGPEDYLRGQGLTRPQLSEMRRRYDGWTVNQEYDRDGVHLKFTAKKSAGSS